MYLVLLAGGIASGKSTVARVLEERGALRLDLDDLSREVTAPGAGTCALLADAFGADVIDPRDGALRRSVLAERAFASDETTRTLEGIVHPAIRELLEKMLTDAAGTAVCVVEVPLLDHVAELASRADEVVSVVCPLPLRRERAQGRGMTGEDFDARVAHQPSESYLRTHSDTVWENAGDQDELLAQVDAWWRERELAGWERV